MTGATGIEGIGPLSKPEFFASVRPNALSYGDVRLVEGASPFSEMFDASDTDLTSHWTPGIELAVPLVSAAMDTVTGSRMAITIEKLGGLGVMHANMTIEEMVAAVREVKFALSARIDAPITVSPDQTLAGILAQKRSFGSFPVLDNEQRRVIGMVTGRNFKYRRHSIEDTTAGMVMTPVEKLEAKGTPDTTVQEAHAMMEEHMVGAVPLLNKDGTLAGLYTWKDVDAIISGDAAKFTVDERGRLRAVVAVSSLDRNVIERIVRVNGEDNFLDGIVVDASRGASKWTRLLLKELVDAKLGIEIVAGNVSEPETGAMLLDEGADAIKTGQGPGSICTTREVIGYGTPQLTAVYETARVAHKRGKFVCADGGIQSFGDIGVAFAGEADSVMMGGMFAGTEEAPGKDYIDGSGNRVKDYRGMGSEPAMADNPNARDYSSSGGVILPEGVTKPLPFKGSVVEIFKLCERSLRSALAATGNRTLDEFRENARFRLHTGSAQHESRPHEVRN